MGSDRCIRRIVLLLTMVRHRNDDEGPRAGGEGTAAGATRKTEAEAARAA